MKFFVLMMSLSVVQVAFAEPGDKVCGDAIFKRRNVVENSFRVCGVITEETAKQVKIDLEDENRRLLAAWPSRHVVSKKICQAFGYEKNVFLGTDVVRKYGTAHIFKGGYEAVGSDKGTLATFAGVTCVNRKM